MIICLFLKYYIGKHMFKSILGGDFRVSPLGVTCTVGNAPLALRDLKTHLL